MYLVECRGEIVSEYQMPVILNAAKDLRLFFQTAGNKLSATGCLSINDDITFRHL